MKMSLVAAAIAVSILLSACASNAEIAESECDSYRGLIVVVGVHANEPAPDLPPGLTCGLKATIAQGYQVGIIANDGAPRVILPPRSFVGDAKNDATRKNDLIAAYNLVVTQIQGASAESAGSDLFDAIMLANDLAVTAQPAIQSIVIIDSGLPDCGPVDMTQPGATLVEPSQLVDHLQQTGELKVDDFSGRHIEFWSLAYTAEPQKTLAGAQNSAVTALWLAIVEAGGGIATAIPYPRSGAPADTALETGIVEVITPRQPDLASGVTVSFDGLSALAFPTGSANLIDPDSAAITLEPLVAWLDQDPTRSLIITGRTDSENPDGNSTLSANRATTVRDVMLELGADGSRLHIVGAGYTASPPDRLPDGSLDPYAAALNRVTEISLVGQ